MLSKQATQEDRESSMDDLIWAGIWSVFVSNILKNAFVIGVVLGWIGYGFVATKWKAERWKGVYDTIKQESDLAPMLDTPQKRDELMEGNTTYCYPRRGATHKDMSVLRRIVPLVQGDMRRG